MFPILDDAGAGRAGTAGVAGGSASSECTNGNGNYRCEGTK